MRRRNCLPIHPHVIDILELVRCMIALTDIKQINKKVGYLNPVKQHILGRGRYFVSDLCYKRVLFPTLGNRHQSAYRPAFFCQFIFHRLWRSPYQYAPF